MQDTSEASTHFKDGKLTQEEYGKREQVTLQVSLPHDKAWSRLKSFVGQKIPRPSTCL